LLASEDSVAPDLVAAISFFTSRGKGVEQSRHPAATPRLPEADYLRYPQSIGALRAAPGSSKLIAY
jgi:hypothetical protein